MSSGCKFSNADVSSILYVISILISPPDTLNIYAYAVYFYYLPIIF
jgi:hypothetical protein